MTDKLAFITDDVANLKEQGLFINIRTMESPVDAWMTVDGKRVLNFCTNNYLGLANHPKIKEAAKRAIDEWGAGPGAVRIWPAREVRRGDGDVLQGLRRGRGVAFWQEADH
jgi:glycine C-acetyltransferase